jgi:UPF0271 protein
MDQPPRRGSRRVLLLDTSAFISGYEMLDASLEHLTVPEVTEELREGSLTRLRLENAQRSGRLKIFIPEPRYVEEVETITLQLGEREVLSAADKQLLALGLQVKEGGGEPVIVSDDYSVQNTADRMSLGFQSLSTRGIKRRFEWTIYCPGCRKVFEEPQRGGVCPICGTQLKRKPGRKQSLRGRSGSGAEPGNESPITL